MARIDLLTAQMCRRAAKRLSVQSDEKMQFFGAGGELLGEGAALSCQTIHEFLLQMAPIPFDGVPVSFPYQGSDGEFQILVAAKCRGFEIHALSLSSSPTQADFSRQPAGQNSKSFGCGWSISGNTLSASAQAKPSLPVTGLGPSTYELRKDDPEKVTRDDTN